MSFSLCACVARACVRVSVLERGISYRELSPASVTALLIPLGVDDPEKKGNFSKVIIDLYNGAKQGTLSRGEIKPRSTVVISSNASPHTHALI